MAKVKNIDVEKFLAALDKKEKDATYNNMLNIKVEEARYNQERETLNQIIDMFYSTAYEKQEENNNDNSNDNVTITKAQYEEYLALANEADAHMNCVMEEDLDNWQKDVLGKLVSCLKSEDYLIYGANKEKKICNISYEELDKVIAYAFACTLDEIKKLEG